MTFSKLFNPAQGIWNKSWILPQWADVGYKKGAPIDYAALSVGAARPTTIPDIKAAVMNEAVSTVILPQGDISMPGILDIKPTNLTILGHENGTNILWEQDLFELFGYMPGASDEDKQLGKYGYAWTGGSIWVKTRESEHIHDIILARFNSTFKTPYTYLGHWREKRNTLYLVDKQYPYMVENCVIQDMTVTDAENCAMIFGKNCTVRNMVYKQTSAKTPFLHPGDNYIFHQHYGGVNISGENNLVDNIDLRMLAYHDLFPGTSHSVFRNIRGKNLNIDFHHDGGSYNLFDSLNTGLNTRPWNSAARDDRKNTGPGNVFWNLRTGSNQRLSTFPPDRWWVEYGVKTPKKYAVIGHTQSINDGITWVEKIGMDLEPASLYQALKNGMPVPPPSTNKFKIGDRVVASTTTANVRALPGVNNPKLMTQPLGTRGTIKGGPVTVPGDTYIWYRIDYDSGSDGWTGQGSLELA